MTKGEAERAIRYLCGVWAKESGIPLRPTEQPSFSDFKAWLHGNGHGHYLAFKSLAGPDYDAEAWFDHEFGQGWRN